MQSIRSWTLPKVIDCRHCCVDTFRFPKRSHLSPARIQTGQYAVLVLLRTSESRGQRTAGRVWNSYLLSSILAAYGCVLATTVCMETDHRFFQSPNQFQVSMLEWSVNTLRKLLRGVHKEASRHFHTGAKRLFKVSKAT